MLHHITVMPQNQHIQAAAGSNLLDALRNAGYIVNAPCGGNGSCGKCKVLIDGKEALACQTTIDRDMTLTLPEAESVCIPSDRISHFTSGKEGLCLTFDIGTTTVAGYLLDGTSGQELASQSILNPQISYGADVITRIRHAMNGQMENLTEAIRSCISSLALTLCKKAGVHIDQVTTLSIVGNPAMQQLFLGIPPENLARIPFSPVLTQAQVVKAKAYLPICEHADLLIIPNISGFIGADTLGCILATGLHNSDELTLLVDIGTNGEMVLGNKNRMVACSAAAGPALEGANIQFGMRGQSGAIDHVHLESEQFHCSVIGDVAAVGICGSGIVDALAAALDAGMVNQRGKIHNNDRLQLTDNIYLTQEDIHQVQMTKGAIAAGITLMTEHLGVQLHDIQKVFLAGAFGTFMDPRSACRIGLLPPELEDKITAVGNAAGIGAKMIACDISALTLTQQLVTQIEYIELSGIAGFGRCFAQNMRFCDSREYWCKKAIAMGFSKVASLNVDTLRPMQDIRDMCAADKCGAYGKNWTCPPHCGTLEECNSKMRSYSSGILLQTIGTTEKAVDTKAYRRTEAQHLAQFHAFCDEIRKFFPDALCLGSGGCRICKKCAFPEECRFPDKACSSMEGYGLFVTQVCRDNGLDYHYGNHTITYTACILF